jgi:hypothetical protein
VSVTEYLIGVALLSGVTGALAASSINVRRLALPGWTGAPARLAETVIALGALVIVAQVLGTVGAFSRWWLLFACLLLAAAVSVARRRLHQSATQHTPAPDASRPPTRAGIALAAVAATIAAALWVEKTLAALERGMLEYDTLWYHMPFAARFAQEGWVTRLHYVGNPPVSFLPANSELVHAVGIVTLGNDLLSPLLNLGWLAFAFLGAWCIGRPYGVAPACVCAVALVASIPVMVESQAGAAKNDIVGLALFLAAVGLVLNGRDVPAATALAGAAAGLAVGTRVTLIPAIVALSAAAIALSPRLLRRRFATIWALALLAAGSFWYLRNLGRVGNPFPWVGFSVGDAISLPSTTATIDCGATTLAGYAADGRAFRDDILPFLPVALGGAWLAALGLAALGIGAGLASGRSRAVAVAGIALVSAFAYALTPATAGGEAARCFYYNTRFATPALALAIICVPLALVGRRVMRNWIRERWVAGGITAVLIFVAPFSPEARATAIALVLVVLVLSASTIRARVPAPFLVGAVAVAAAIALALGWAEQREYLDQRYTRGGLPEGIEPSYALLRETTAARVAVAGFFAHYPLYGRELSNRVDFPVRGPSRARFTPLDCRSWQRALKEAGYDYVVTLRSGDQQPLERQWTRRYMRAREVFATRGNTVFRLTRQPAHESAVNCPG